MKSKIVALLGFVALWCAFGTGLRLFVTETDWKIVLIGFLLMVLGQTGAVNIILKNHKII